MPRQGCKSMAFASFAAQLTIDIRDAFATAVELDRRPPPVAIAPPAIGIEDAALHTAVAAALRPAATRWIPAAPAHQRAIDVGDVGPALLEAQARRAIAPPVVTAIGDQPWLLRGRVPDLDVGAALPIAAIRHPGRRGRRGGQHRYRQEQRRDDAEPGRPSHR